MNVKCLHERLQEFIENLETASIHKMEIATFGRYFLKIKSFMNIFLSFFRERSVQVLSLLNSDKKKDTKFFTEKSHRTTPFILFDVIF